MRAGLWQVLSGFSIGEGLVQVIQALYENSSGAVLLNNQLGEVLKTTVGVRQGCLLSPVPFNLFLEKIMHETPHDYHTSISTGGRPICSLRFADEWAAAMVNCKTSSTDSETEQRHMEWKSAQKRATSGPTARTTSVQIFV